jgi:hypothetical protein
MRNEVSPFGQMSKTADDLGCFPLGGRSITKTPLQYAHNKRQGRGVQVMDERHFDQAIKSIFCILGGIAQGFEQDAYQALDFWVADNLSETLKTAVCRGPDFLV